MITTILGLHQDESMTVIIIIIIAEHDDRPVCDYEGRRRTCTRHPGSRRPKAKQICPANKLQEILLLDSMPRISPAINIIIISVFSQHLSITIVIVVIVIIFTIMINIIISDTSQKPQKA